MSEHSLINRTHLEQRAREPVIGEHKGQGTNGEVSLCVRVCQRLHQSAGQSGVAHSHSLGQLGTLSFGLSASRDRQIVSPSLIGTVRTDGQTSSGQCSRQLM